MSGLRLTIDRLGHLGDGIARGPEGPVYLPLTLPGEAVEAGPDGRLRILTPSPQRVSPPCPHYRTCGGCALQHASDGFVAGWKAEVLTRALAAQGLAAPIVAHHLSPPSSRRRATLAGRRGKAGALVGFHARASAQVVATPHCLLLRPELMACLPQLAAITRAGASRRDELALALTLAGNGVDLAVSGGRPLTPALSAAVLGAAEGRFCRITWGDEVLAQTETPWLALGRARVPLPPGAFLQATVEGEAALLAAVRRALGPARRVVDLFAGLGTFALPLAEAAEIHAVEGAPALVAALQAGWRATPGLRPLTAEARDLFRNPLGPDALARYDAAVLDPPRAGAEAQVARLAEARLPVIAHVSCNPVTFARDARTLVAAGYRLDWIALVDQFRWSPHLELAARFSRPR